MVFFEGKTLINASVVVSRTETSYIDITLGFDSSCPFEPVLVSPSAIDPENLRLKELIMGS